MLVLTRNPDESIVIGDDVEFTVLNVSRNTVDIRVDTPHSVSVNRSEAGGQGGQMETQSLTKNGLILIGDEIEVKVLGIYGRQAKLGIKAPRDVAVHRSEVYFQIKRSASQPLLLNEVV